MMEFSWLEEMVLWLGRNALLTVLPASLIAVLCWLRWGSAQLRWVLVGLLLLKLVLPAWPGWGWTVPLPTAVEVWEVGSTEGLQVQGAWAELAIQVEAEGGGVAWWAVVWGMGVLACVGLWLASAWRVNTVIRRNRVSTSARLAQLLEEEGQRLGLREMPELCVLRGWGQAAVHGCWRARVLLPADWERSLEKRELRAVLRHELAHVRRKDVLWSALGYLVAAVHWFHPLGWLALRRLRAETELLCDEVALSGHGEAERKQYGRVLIRMMETFATPPPTAVAAFARHKNDIQHRILMIAQPNQSQRWSRAAAWLIFPLLSLALLTAGEGERKSERVEAREGERIRDGDKPREGARDGERSREGMREGDKPREGARDGERSREGMREGEASPREGGQRTVASSGSAQAMVIQLNAAGEVVNSEGRVIPDAEVKERIGQLARSRPGQEIVLKGEKETRYESLARVLNLLRGIDVKPMLAP